jgi:4-amino-4-deoxy-L-arabinose transferase-like glycosyltransferase
MSMRIRSTILTTLAVAAAAVVAAVAPASAATAAGSAKAAAAHADFSAQARGAGLSASQASALQAKVDTYLAKTGGTQVGANKIDLGGKGVLVLAVPGQAQARDLSSPSAVKPLYTCAYYHFCAFDETGWAGDVLDWFYCGTYSMPWFTTGSFEDHQSSGTWSTLHEVNNGSASFQAPLDDIDIDWSPVLSVTVC